MVSFIVAIIFTLLFEVPFMNIEKYILFPKKKQVEKVEAKEESGQTSKKEEKSINYFKMNDTDETFESKEKLLDEYEK